MDKSILKGMVLGGLAVTAVTAVGVTGFQTIQSPKYAEVISVQEVNETVRTPREECKDVTVQKRAPVVDKYRVAGTAAGVVAGGLLGSTIGNGKGNQLATVAGAAAGGYAGNTIQKSMQDQDVQTANERRCKVAYDVSTRHLGFDVTYRLGNKDSIVRMTRNPGPRIPVRDGKPVLDEMANT